MSMTVTQYRKCKLLRGIDVSEKAGKVWKTMNDLDVRRLLASQKQRKDFCGDTVLTHRSAHVKRRSKSNSNGNGGRLNLGFNKDHSLLGRIVTGAEK
ncbi:hypothetical protein TNCV_2221811 [Trichonephila clavipes]|nr:hypothetical protein TNCV_2221811 [Trichonephila clavipes]